MKGRHQRRRPSKTTTTKRIVWACLINGIGWVWCSYALAFLGRTEIAESLSRTAVTEIIGVVLLYCVKSLFEKRESFGGSRNRKEETGQRTYERSKTMTDIAPIVETGYRAGAADRGKHRPRQRERLHGGHMGHDEVPQTAASRAAWWLRHSSRCTTQAG